MPQSKKMISDTIGHKVLVGKLRKYGIREPSGNWLKSWRARLCRQIMDESVGHLHVAFPGSCLSPLHFMIYMNDFEKRSKSSWLVCMLTKPSDRTSMNVEQLA